jgi:hypothetical protein
MRAIALSLLFVSFGAVTRADTHDEIVDLFASMAAALSDDNAPGFMKVFDRNMTGYDELRRQIEALILDFEISSSVEPLNDETKGPRHAVDLDWYLQLHSRAPAGPTFRRRQIVHCRLELQGKHWRIVSLDPLSFFKDKME